MIDRARPGLGSAVARLSLGARLVLLIVATIVPLTAFTVMRHYFDYRRELATSGQKTLELARSLAISIEKDIEGRIAVLEVLALSQFLQDGRIDDFRDRAMAVIRDQFPGSNILLLRPDGQQLLNTRTPPGTPLLVRRNMATIAQVMATGRPAVSEVFTGVTLQRPLVSIDVPVKQADGRIAYILSFNPPFDAFAHTIRRLRLPDGWTATVYDQSGVIVTRNIDPEGSVGQKAPPELMGHLLSLDEGVVRTVSREGHAVMAAFSRVQPMAWSVVLGVPLGTITGPAVEQLLRTLLEATIVLLLGLALALVVARQVTRPMATLRGLATATDGGRILAAPGTGLPEADEVMRALQEAERRRRVSERRRQEAERASRRIFETSQDVMFVTDSYGTFLQVSPSVRAVLGYAPEEMEGRSGRDFTDPDDLEATRAEIRTAKRGRAIRNFRSAYLHKDGHVVPMEWMAVWSETDRRFFYIGRDMTESDRREAELRQAQKMEVVGQLTGGVAHDFNNLLMVILANVEALEDDEALDPGLRDRLDAIGDATDRAAGLTRQLLAFSRKQTLRPEVISVNDLVAATARLLRRTLGDRVEVALALAPDLWSVEIDRAQLEAALINLALNARDAMPSGGRLTIATRNATLDETAARFGPDATPGDHVVLQVSDTGTGMPPEVRAHAFEPFFTTKDVGKGSGLGLSMVYGFVTQSRGHVEIESAAGRGTSISLFLPRAPEAAEAAPPPHPPHR